MHAVIQSPAPLMILHLGIQPKYDKNTISRTNGAPKLGPLTGRGSPLKVQIPPINQQIQN